MTVYQDPSRELGFAGHMRPGNGKGVFQRWDEGNPDTPAIRYGTVIKVNTQDVFKAGEALALAGTIDVACTDGTIERNCEVLVGPSDWGGDWKKSPHRGQEDVRPYLKSRCLILTGPGGETFAAGFTRAYSSGFTSETGHDERSIDIRAGSEGDWYRESPSGAKIVLTRGGIIQLQSSPGLFIQMSPDNGEAFVNTQTTRWNADGYRSRRGRLPGNSVSPNVKTLSREIFQDGAMASTATHLVEDNGAAGTAAKPALRKITIKQNGVVDIATEYYTTTGDFVGQMLGYHYGSETSKENFVLGQQLKKFLSSFLRLFSAHTHASAVGPTSPPETALEAEQLRVSPIEDEGILCQFMFTQQLPPML